MHKHTCHKNLLRNALHQSWEPSHHLCSHFPPCTLTTPPYCADPPRSHTHTQWPQWPVPFSQCTILPTTHLFINLADSHAHVHMSIWDHHLPTSSTCHTATPTLWHPTISPWGCYVHSWNGHAGLCLSMLLVGHAFQIQHFSWKHAISPVEQACIPNFPPTIISLDNSLSSGLGTITQPSTDRKSVV